MGKMKFKQDPFKMFQDIQVEADRFIEKYATELFIKYLEQYEPETITNLVRTIPDQINKAFTESEDIEKTKDLMRLWCSEWKNAYIRMGVRRTKEDLARIHILKKQLKINAADYRSILMQEAGDQSAAEMRKFQIALAERGMRLFAEGKLKVIPWDRSQ